MLNEHMKVKTRNTVIQGIKKYKQAIKKEIRSVQISFYDVGLPRFELGKTGPESVVLPLHHSPIVFDGAKIQNI